MSGYVYSGERMKAEDVATKVGEIGIIPIVRAHSPSVARLAVDAICAGGLPIVEITMTVPDAIAVIRHVIVEYGQNVLVGAGTVTTQEQVWACIEAGAQFLVSPGLSLKVLQAAASAGVLAIPGVLTPTEVMAAKDAGINLVKIFPCGSAGGPAHIKALKGPFPSIRMIPTGGVNLGNVSEYFAAGAFALGVGSEVVSEKALRNNDGAMIEHTAAQFFRAVRQARL
jgi:2-dehydro-3-deoxyphosphogluconate aldolase / (4S)-4-hydroxy-2-oxoglutarate aldolase